MDIILYNPLSSNGKNLKLVAKLKKKLAKQNIKTKEYNLIEIENVRDFIDKRQNVHRFIIIGGDGTISRLSNAIKGLRIKPGIFIYKAGTGNDFVRSLKRKRGLIDIKRFLKDLPTVKVNNEELFFLNGVGLGVDGFVCDKVNNSVHKKNKLNYFRHALEAFREFTPQNGQVILDNDRVIEVKKALFVAVMNSKYFGGGMKIAPKANRLNEDVEVAVVSNVPKFMLFLLIPTIYFGLHVLFKKYVRVYTAKEVLITFDNHEYMQVDGEVITGVKQIKVIK